MLLAKKYTNALVQSATHEDEFEALCINIPLTIIDSWMARILTWEFD